MAIFKQKNFPVLSNSQTLFFWDMTVGIVLNTAVLFNNDAASNIGLVYDWIAQAVILTSTLLFIITNSWFVSRRKFFETHPNWLWLLSLANILVVWYAIVQLNFGISLLLLITLHFNAFLTLRFRRGLLVFMISYFPLLTMLPDIINSIGFFDTFLWTFLAVDLILLILATFILRDAENRRQVDKLVNELQNSNRRLETYAQNIAQLTVIEERNRIAREIHDSLGHSLTAISIQLERAKVYQNRDSEQVMNAIQTAQNSSRQALKDIRSSVNLLRTEEHFSLEEQAGQLIENLRQSVPVNYTFSGDQSTYNYAVLLVLFRTLQETITNIQRHSKATLATIQINLERNNATLQIEDNGIGFDMDENATDSYGLIGIRERVEMVNGSAEISSHPQQGTILTIKVPADPVNLFLEELEASA